MDYVTLTVTQPVFQAVQAGQASQRQIAVQAASPSVLAIIAPANASNLIDLKVGGSIALRVGDTRAVWAAHQTPATQPDFDDLYALLSRRVGVGVTFAV